VLSGGERTRLAVARMLLRPSNTLLLDEPTNHLDLDSKDVLLDALADYGGTLIFVSHDRYFVERLATKIVEVGGGQAVLFPGTYPEFLWRKEHPDAVAAPALDRQRPDPPKNTARAARAQAAHARATEPGPKAHTATPANARHAARPANAAAEHEARKRARAEQTRRDRELQARRSRLADLEGRIADRERAIAELEATMAAPGFYEQRDAAQPVIDRHQALMWEVGELMHQWETLSELVENPTGA
jgi:ATP-binding cassette subfamily F protein 3